MNEYNLKKLQNGSDIRGISLTGVGGSGVPNLRDAEACLLSKGFLFFSIPQNAPRKKKTLAFSPRWV